MIKIIPLFFSVKRLLNIDNMIRGILVEQDLSNRIVDLHTNVLGLRKISSQFNLPLSSDGKIVLH